MNDFTGRIKRDEWKPPSGALNLSETFPGGPSQDNTSDVFSPSYTVAADMAWRCR